MADAFAQYRAAARIADYPSDPSDVTNAALATLVGANVIADAIAAQTAAVQANTAAVADLAQQIYEDGMYDADEEVDEDWDVDQPLDERLRGLGDA